MEYFSSNLKFLREKAGVTQETVSKALKFSSMGRLSNYEKGVSEPDLETLIALGKYYHVSIDGLLNADLSAVDQLRQHKRVKALKEPAEEYGNTGDMKAIPLIPFDAMAGDGNGHSQITYMEKYIVPDFNKQADFLIRIAGTSMNPKFFNGDVLACKKIPLKTFIQWGKVYVMYTDQGPLCKRLFPGAKKGHVRVVSDNEVLYPAFEMDFKEIKSLGMVIGLIRLE